MGHGFTHIRGFETEEELEQILKRLFPNKKDNAFVVVRAYDEYYGVTFLDTWSQVCVSREYVRYRYLKSLEALPVTGLIRTEQFPVVESPFSEPNTFKPWNGNIIKDFKNYEGDVKVISPLDRGRDTNTIKQNAMILVLCLFADCTRNNDMATYSSRRKRK